MMFTQLQLYFTYILYCDGGPSCCFIRLFTSTVGRLSQIYLPSYVFLRRSRSFTLRKLYACLEKFLCFMQLSDRVFVYGAR